MKAVVALSEAVGVVWACAALDVSRATYYRHRQPPRQRRAPKLRRPSPRALTPAERRAVLDLLHSPRFVDRSPAAVHATLLDEDRYLCSRRTMYRLLEGEKEVRERRNQCRRPAYAKPELLATGPNQVWTWDLTKLRAARKWTYYWLYVVLDLFSRYGVAWMLARRESGDLARELFAQAYAQQGIQPGQLTVHSDRGGAPTAKTLTQLYADLGVEPSLSRPHVSNDNPFSEAQFKTMKYAPGYPDRFGSYEDAHGWCRRFFPWYNTEHRHSALEYLTPQVVHYGRAPGVLDARQRALDRAYAAHPERFPNGPPRAGRVPEAVWINPPEDEEERREEIQ